MSISNALKKLGAIDIDFGIISTLADFSAFQSQFGYYFLLNNFEKCIVFKVFDHAKLLLVEQLAQAGFGFDVQCRRIRSSDVRGFLVQESRKKYYAVELDTIASFKRKANTWKIHNFKSTSDRKNWLINMTSAGSTVRSVTALDLSRYIVDKEKRFYYAAINPKGVGMNHDDLYWKFYQFANRRDRNNWVSKHNQIYAQAKQVCVADLYKFSKLKYELPLITDGCGQLIINSQNRSSKGTHKYYLGLNSVSIISNANDSHWKVYACASLKEAKDLIITLNAKAGGVEVAKKISREFAYSILKLQSFEETFVNEFNEVITNETLSIRRKAS